jgi:hypothetical protein
LDFFTVQFSKPTDSVEGWTRDLEQCIAFVEEKPEQRKVVLIGYRRGWIDRWSSLSYKTCEQSSCAKIDHYWLRRHQGSAFAKVYNWKTAVNSVTPRWKREFLEPNLSNKLSELIRKAENDVPFDSPAVRDLRRPQDGGWFIEKSENRERSTWMRICQCDW